MGETAHGAYLAAINSNNVETPMADLTDNIVYQSPSEPEIVGKTALRKWATNYIEAYGFKWEKTSIGFIVSGPRQAPRTPASRIVTSCSTVPPLTPTPATS
ncbi:MAG: nuclear transport factor 2 family protein [Aliidongia sp.]